MRYITQAVISGVLASDGVTSQTVVVQSSAPLAALLGSSAKACLDSGNATACNALANLCVLQFHDKCALRPILAAARCGILIRCNAQKW